MPKLHPQLADSIFYLYRRDPKTGAIEGPCGTGSIVAKRAPVPIDTRLHLYGVSNHHVAVELGASIVRLNTIDGKSRFLEYDPLEWHFLPNGDDIAMLDLTDDVDIKTDKIACIGEWIFLTERIVERYEIGLGEDAFMIGMFADHHGGKRNKPAARFGNLSLVADKDAPVEQPNRAIRPCHLVDMRSRTGFSGSPVFLYRIPAGDLTSPHMMAAFIDNIGFSINTGTTTRKNWFVGLLGVHCGQFRDVVEVWKSSPRSERIGDPIKEGDKLYIQSGMTIVVPAWRITELWDIEVFQIAREKRDAKRRLESENKPQAEPVLPASDENSNRREDFERLLGESAKSQTED